MIHGSQFPIWHGHGLWRRLLQHVSLALVAAQLAPACSALGEDAREGSDRAAQLERGQAIAVAHCAICHAVGTSDESPTWVNSNTAFRMLHERFPIEMLLEAARTGIISGHDEMPGFDFSPDEVADLLAYIDSLAPEKPGYIERSGQH